MLLAVTGQSLHAQIEEPPLYYVTVNPETGYDCIKWLPSPSPEVDYYEVVVTDLPPGEPVRYTPVGFHITDTTWCNPNSESSLHPVGYTVWGVDDRGPGEVYNGGFEPGDSTLFLQSALDSCIGSLTLNWNDYSSWLGSLLEYKIYRRIGPGNYQEIASVNTNTYTLNNVQSNQTYDLFVEAVHNDGKRTSTSNRVQVFTQLSDQPDFINADYATINPVGGIDLSFTIGGTTNLTRYKLMRSTNESGPFSEITVINSTDSHILYTDDVPFTSGIYFYRLELINNCNAASGQSNLASNVLLGGSHLGNVVSLGWSDYREWEGGIERYRVIRTRGRDNPVTDTLDAGTGLNFSDDLTGLIDYTNPSSGFICYQIKATENMNVYGIKGISWSNQVCFSITPDIRMPNAFIPNDAEPVNQLFEPVFSFLPESYELYIYNRLGTRIWQGSGAWDGRAGGSYVPEGVYLYLLRVFNYSSEVTELSGKVTVVYR